MSHPRPDLFRFVRAAQTLLLPAILAAGVLAGQSTTRVSVRSDGTQLGYVEQLTWISPDGRYVAFLTRDPDVVPGDTNGTTDGFVHDRVSGTTQRVTLGQGNSELNGWVRRLSLTADLSHAVFISDATNVVPGDTNGKADAFIRNLSTGATRCISVSSNGTQADADTDEAVISADGNIVVLTSAATNLVPNDTAIGDVFVRDLQAGTTELVSQSTAGVHTNHQSFSFSAPSNDGRFVVFGSFASNLVPFPLQSFVHVYLRDRLSGTTELISVGTGGTLPAGPCYDGAISADGRYVAFSSWANNLDPADPGGSQDVFLRDRVTGITEAINRDASGALPTWGNSYPMSVSSDGRFVSMVSRAQLVPLDTNGMDDVYVRDRALATTVMVSTASNGALGTSDCNWGFMSSDGRYVAFEAYSDNLVPGDTNFGTDVFVTDLASNCEPITSYCAGKANSVGCVPAISTSGLPSLSGPDTFFVTASQMRNQTYGTFIFGTDMDAVPFGGGVLCVGGNVRRAGILNSGGHVGITDCSGVFSFAWTHAFALAQGYGPGSVVLGQFYSRDSGFAAPNNLALTDGILFVMAP